MGRTNRHFAPHLLGMWCQETRTETVPLREKGVFKHPRLTVIYADRGPQANPIRGETIQGGFSRAVDITWQAQRRRRRPKGLPDSPAQLPTTRVELQETGWQALQRSRRSQGLPDPPAWPLQNRFAGLPEEAVEKDSAYSQEYPKLPSQPQKTPVVCKTERRPAVKTQEVSPQRPTDPGAPSRTKAATSCPEKFWVKLPLLC